VVAVLPLWRKGYRRRGVTSRLIAAAIEAARRAQAPALEAHPFDAEVSPSASGSGYASTFARAGFVEVARRTPARPIMRYELEGTADVIDEAL
jgi:GNAT superfamily N-acetyltransferase